jgi:ubiquinone/menaquinone biosynthesis C-methylase UbiE
MKQLDQEAVKDFYGNVSKVWPQDNAWYSYLTSGIENYVQKKCNLFEDAYILHAGSGGNNYGIVSDNMYHVDIAENKIAHLRNAVIASVENLPFPDGMFDYIICVGSVINYCDAIASIAEMSRVLKRHGILILEFENSFGFEFLGSAGYGKSAEIVTTQYMGQSHRQWVYSLYYIKNILKQYSLKIRNLSAFHILSGLHYNIYNDENAAANFAKFDYVARYIPLFRKHAANIILSCRKL